LRNVEYDFLAWTSFPSSLKAVNDGVERRMAGKNIVDLVVSPGAEIKAVIKAKQQNVLGPPAPLSRLSLVVSEAGVPPWSDITPKELMFPSGTFDWTEFQGVVTVPSGIRILRVVCNGGWGTETILGITWFDDLEIYQDDVLIFHEDFSNWNPYIGAGLGGVGGAIAGYLIKPKEPLVPALVGACLGAVLGGGVGYFTAVPRASSPESPERQVQYATVR